MGHQQQNEMYETRTIGILMLILTHEYILNDLISHIIIHQPRHENNDMRHVRTEMEILSIIELNDQTNHSFSLMEDDSHAHKSTLASSIIHYLTHDKKYERKDTI